MKKIQFVVFIFLLVILSGKIHSQTSTGYWYINFHEPNWGGTIGTYKFCGAYLTLADGTNIFYDQYDYDFLNSTHNIKYESRPVYLSIYGTCSTCSNYGLLFEEDLSQLSEYTVYRYNTPLCDGYSDGWGMELLWYPWGPTSISLAPDYSNVYNENDDVEWVVTFPAGSKKVTRWKRKVGNGSWQTIYPYKIPGQDCYKDNLSNLNVTESITVTYRVYTYDTGIQSEEYAQSTLITVYPRRPRIKNASGNAPLCYAGGDGTLTIKEIDGALGGGTVDKYKITIKRGACSNNADTLNIEGVTPVLPWKYEANRYIENFPVGGITYDTTMFWNKDGQNPIVGDTTYCILIENVYLNSDSSTWANGNTFTNIFVPEKALLTGTAPNTTVNCNRDTNGEILFTANGGNPEYNAYLYNSSNEKIDSILNMGQQGGQTKSESHTFTDLPAGEYYIQLIDEYGCYINNTDTNLTEIITVSQPDSLKLEISQIDSVLCKGDSTGKFTLFATGGNPENELYYKYNVLKEEQSFITDEIILKDSILTIDTLHAATYKFQLTDKKGCKTKYENFTVGDSSIIITEPADTLKINSTEIFDHYGNGFAIDCHGDSTGSVTVTPFGGYPEYKYKHKKNGADFVADSVFSNLPAGTHTFYITDASYDVSNESYCLDSVTVVLNEPSVLEIDTLPLNKYVGNFNIKCHGGTDTIKVNSIGGVGFYKYKLPNGSFIENNFFEAYGDNLYFVTVKDSNQCVAIIDSIELSQPTSLPAITSSETENYNGFGVHCNGDSDGIITINPNITSGTTINGIFEYSIDNGINFQTDSVFTGQSAGTYDIKIKDANGCLSNALGDTIQIIQPQLLTVSATDTIKYRTFEIKCKGDANGGFTLNGSGGTESLPTPYTYFLDGIETNNIVSDKPAGTYSYYVKDLNDCISETGNVNLTEPDAITFTYDTTNTYVGNHAIRCFGMTDSVKITPFGGYGASLGGHYNVELNSISGLINPGETSKYFDIVANNYYNLNITDANGCILNSLNVFSVTQPDVMQILFKDTVPTMCHDTQDGKLNARWSGGTSSYSNTYDYYLKQGNNIIQTLEDVNIADTVTFTGIEAYLSYKVIAIDDNACEDSIETSTTSPEELLANTANTTQPLCFGDTLGILTISNVTGGTTNTEDFYDFYIKTSYGDSIFITDTDQATFENIGTGTHQYFIMDDNDCVSDAASFDITEPTEMTVSTTTQNVSAQGGSNGSAIANPSGGTGTFNRYKWRNSNDEIIAEDVNNIENVPAGDYSLEVWDDNDCPYGNSSTGLLKYFTIYEPGQMLELYIVQQHNVSTPGGNDGSVSLDANGGWGQYLYKKNSEGIYTPASIFTGLKADTYWFYVKDEYGTKDSLQTTITEAEALLIDDITTQNVNCNGNADGTATILVSGGTLPYLYSLDNTNFSENNIFENLDEGTYTVYVKDLYGNQTNQTFSISQPEELTVSIIDVGNTSCGQSDGSATADVDGGTTPYIYDWYLNGEHIGQYDATAENLEAGLYTVEVTDANSCTASAQETVYNSNGPEIENIITTDALCYNTSDGTATITDITASGLYTIQWSTGQTDVMNINNLEPGSYSVEINDENECSVIEAFTINAPDELSFNFNTNSPTCYDGCNGSITANLSGGSTPYISEWQNIAGNPTTNYVGSLCADDYVLHVTDANNCFYSGTANLENPEQILILEENQATICQGQSITLDAGNPGSTYQWTSDNGFQSNDRTVTINEAGTYNITVYSPIGCVAEDEFSLSFSNSFLQANFLMQSEAEIADTVVLVEISWEAPDSVSWNIPNELWVLTQSEENLQLVPTQNGIYTVGLTAYLGSCSDYIEKQISITGSPDKGIHSKPKYSTDEVMQFKSVNLYPNPNKGNFTLDISLYEKDDIQVEVYDLLGQLQQTHKIGKGEKNYTFNFNINNLNKGLYFISIKTNKGSAGIKFLKQ